jgi:PAS domain S-box-containing protein
MLKKLKIPLIMASALLSTSAIVYLIAFSQRDLKETSLLTTLIVLVLGFSYLVIYRNSQEINMVQSKVRFWKEKAIFEEEAKRSKNYLETILNNSSDLICLVKRDGTLGYVNPASENMLGYSPEELRGENLLELVTEHQQELVKRKWKEMNETIKSGTFEANFMKKEGSEFYCHASYSYVQKYDEFLFTLKDVTEQKKLEEKVSAIHGLNRALITLQDPEEIVNAALETAQKILNFEFCDFLLFDEKTNELIIVGNRGESPNSKGQRIPLYADIKITKAFDCAREAISMTLGDDMGEYVPTSFQEDTTLTIPVMTKDKVVGMLYLKTEEDQDLVNNAHMLLSEMASQTAVAIENVQLNKSILESEEKYRSLVDNIGIGITLISPNMEILSLNNQMMNWFPDIHPDGKPLCYQAYFNPPRDQKCAECPTYKALQDGKIYEAVIDIPGADGFRNYRIVATPIKDETGEIVAAIEMVQDITKHEKMEKALKESEQRFRTIFDCSNDGILLTFLESKKFYTGNNTICQMLGYNLEEIKEMQVSDIHPEEDLPAILDQFEKQASGETSLAKDVPVKRQDGSLFYANINSVSVTLEGVTYLLSSFRDVTEIKRIEDFIKKGKKEWERTFDTVPDLIALIDKEHKITRLNKGMADRLGMNYQEAIGKHCYELIHGTNEPPDACPHAQLMRDGQEQQAEIHSNRLGGDFLVTTTPLYGDQEEMIGSVHVAHNITERKKAEEALKESEEKYRGVVEASLIGVFIIRNGIIKFVNNRLCHMLGYSEDEIVERLGLLDLVHADDRSFAQKSLEDLSNGISKTTEVELKAMKKGGEALSVRILARTVNYKEQPVIIGSLLDLSKEKALELQLIRSQKMESLGQLAGGIAHDFNNILGILAGSLDILQNHAVDEKLKNLATMAMDTVERGSDIVKRLILFGKPEETELVPVSLPLVIDESIRILEHTLEKNIYIKKNIDDPNAVIMGNKEQLLQVLLNICVNARDAMPAGGVLDIRLETTDESYLKERFTDVKEKEYIALHLTDNGLGMDENTKDHMFDPFFTTKEREKVTGLGLSIVHGIVNRHNGLIDVQSSPGHGTTFSIFLPLAPLPERSSLATQEKSEVKGGEEKILIVEDEENLRQVLRELLQPLGYEVLEAQDGAEAMDLFKEKAPWIDLVILDLGLPGISGELVFREMTEIKPEANILIASGYLDHSMKSELYKSGVKEFIQKPYSLKDVALTVRRVLDSRQRETADTPQMI